MLDELTEQGHPGRRELLEFAKLRRGGAAEANTTNKKKYGGGLMK